MSDYESHKGRLVPFPRKEAETDRDYFKRAFGDRFLEDYWDEEEHMIEFVYNCGMEDDVFYVKDTIFFNKDHKELNPYEDIQELESDGQGGYTYLARFYNGGGCLQDVIESALEKELNKK